MSDAQALRFRSRGTYAHVWLTVPAGLVLVLLATGAGLGVIASGDDFYAVVGLVFGLIMGGLFLVWSAYRLWGRLDVERTNELITIRHHLGRVGWTRRIPTSELQHVERYGAFKYGVSIAGPHLVAHVRHAKAPIPVGIGMCLDDHELREIESLLAARA